MLLSLLPPVELAEAELAMGLEWAEAGRLG